MCLKDGERWDTGFMTGLSASWIIVPIVSSGSLEPMNQLFQEDGTPSDWCDNVLLEWIAALELYSSKQVKAIMPIITCDESGGEFQVCTTLS